MNKATTMNTEQLHTRNAALEKNATWMEGELEKRQDELVVMSNANDRNISRALDAEDQVRELEADNARLRRAVLEQATVFATTLKAILPA